MNGLGKEKSWSPFECGARLSYWKPRSLEFA